MTTSLLNLNRPAEPSAISVQPPAQAAAALITAPSPAAAPRTSENEGVDFEIVFGRRQMASTGLVLMVVLACFSGIFYLIGRSAGTKLSAPEPSAATAASLTQTDAPVTAASDPVVKAPATLARVTNPDASKPQAPLFGEALAGNVYIQVGAIEKGLAGIWAEGLRTHGLDSFVATGRNDKEWRVLVGPLPDPQSFRRAKDTLDKLGVNTFGRRYISSDTPAAPPAESPAAP